jgi:1-acyl-sn-glycerol-3-phosphate acyltransferase
VDVQLGQVTVPNFTASGAATASMQGLRRFGIELVRRYHRQTVTADAPVPGEPALFVCNHGFGGIIDLNVLAMLATLEELHVTRPVTYLTHQAAWTLKVGPLLETIGARPASRRTAIEAFAAGRHVCVFPGGDVDAGKAFADRNKIVFAGRSGFARLAIDAGVPIVPIVTAGAGESLFVLTDGQRIAKTLRLHRLLRSRTLPVSLSAPWGLSIGVAGVLPYLPAPTKLRTRVLARIDPGPGEEPQQFADRVATAMQNALDDMTRARRPLLG